MRKNIVKYFSAFLALALILSVLPMAAFASETSECTDAVCSCGDATAYAVICTHNYYIADNYVDVPYDATHHAIHHYEIYTCSLCGETKTVYVGYTLSEHTWQKGVCVYCGCAES